MSAIAFQSHCCLDQLFKAFFVLLWLALPIRCLAGPIDFESLNAPGNGTAGLDVRNQFAGEGVTFQNAAALDYSQGIPISPLSRFPYLARVARPILLARSSLTPAT